MSITVDFTSSFSSAEIACFASEYDAQGYYGCFRATHVVDEADGTSYARSKSRQCRQAACFDFAKAAESHATRRAWRT